MKYNYKQLYQKNVAFYTKHPKAKDFLIRCNLILTAFFILAYVALIGFVTFIEQSPKMLTCVFLIPAIGFFFANVLRFIIDKPRPYAPHGAGITPFIEKKKADNKSFPSRHTACAFVIATTFFAFYPYIGIGMLLLAAFLAYIRFALGLHYPADLTAGALIGLLSGIVAFFF